MVEILTESFCERCGTRYTFEATAPRRRGLGRIRTLSRGVRNFVANDDASFADAMAAAREDDARSASLLQVDAFHRTFNFCMSCRQYTCRNCWNAGVGECLSCAPDLSLEVLPAPFPDLAPVGPDTAASASAEAALPNVAAPAWPTADRRAVRETVAEAAAPVTEPAGQSDIELTATELAAIQSALTRHVSRHEAGQPAHPATGDAPVGVDGAPAGLEAANVPEATFEPSPTMAPPGIPPEPVAGGRAETRRFMRRFRPRTGRAMPTVAPTVVPGAPGDAAAAATVEEAEPVDAVGVVRAVELASQATEPAAAVGPALADTTAEELFALADEAVAAPPEPAVAEAPVVAAREVAVAEAPAAAAPAAPVALEPIAAEVPPVALEPAAAEMTSEIPAAAPPGASAPPPTDVAVQPTWHITAPDSDAPEGSEPALPTWASPGSITRRSSDAMPSASWAARVATARPLESPVWAASSRDLLKAPTQGATGPVGVHSCVSCGLSLSANARFCRRCGSRQG